MQTVHRKRLDVSLTSVLHAETNNTSSKVLDKLTKIESSGIYHVPFILASTSLREYFGRKDGQYCCNILWSLIHYYNLPKSMLIYYFLYISSLHDCRFMTNWKKVLYIVFWLSLVHTFFSLPLAYTVHSWLLVYIVHSWDHVHIVLSLPLVHNCIFNTNNILVKHKSNLLCFYQTCAHNKANNKLMPSGQRNTS